jgi:hypothetical protein
LDVTPKKFLIKFGDKKKAVTFAPAFRERKCFERRGIKKDL